METKRNSAFFQFKQFAIHQDRCAMKVGTDGILLGAWADCLPGERGLDIGTGTGLLSLMLAQRNPDLILDALELDAAACDQASENIQASPFRERIHVFQSNFLDFYKDKKEGYDIIICNPPFFNGMLSRDSSRNKARQQSTLPLENLLAGISLCLKITGKASLIYPALEGKKCLEIAEQMNLFCIQKIYVSPYKYKPVNRLLLTFQKEKGFCQEGHKWIYQERNVYSEWYQELTCGFYLA